MLLGEQTMAALKRDGPLFAAFTARFLRQKADGIERRERHTTRVAFLLRQVRRTAAKLHEQPDLVVAEAPEVALVSDRRYPRILRGMVQRARQRVWASVFIVDVDPATDPGHKVLDVLHELAAARWRRADVRLIVSGSRDNLEIAQAAATAVAVARRLKLPTRWLGARERRGSHAKYVIADDEVMLGSHNWSATAFLGSVQDSAWLRSPSLAAYLSALFAAQWLRPHRELRS
jgi:phosphatidylserine/phosphatidylglycerophosphate/cardiolipin synthase-like enzyme